MKLNEHIDYIRSVDVEIMKLEDVFSYYKIKVISAIEHWDTSEETIKSIDRLHNKTVEIIENISKK